MQQNTLAWVIAAITSMIAIVFAWLWYEQQNTLERLQTRFNNISQDRDRLVRDQTDSRSQLSSLQIELSQAQSAQRLSQEQRLELDAAKDELSTLTQQLSQSQQQLASRTQEWQQAQQATTALQQSVDEQQQLNDDWQQQVQQLSEQLTDWQAKAESQPESDIDIDQLQAELSRLTNERSLLVEQLDEAKTSLARTERMQQQLMSRLDETPAASDDVASAAAGDLAESAAALEALTTERDQLLQRLLELEQDNLELRQRLESSLGQMTDLQQVARELRDARAAADAAERLLGEQEQQLANLNSELSSRANEVSELNQELGLASSEKEGINQRLAVLADERSQLEETKAQLESSRDNSRTELALAQDKAEQLLSENQAYQERIEQLQGELERQSQAANLLASELSELNEERDSLVSDLEDGRTVIRLQGQLLFPSGTAEVSVAGKRALAAVARSLESFPEHRISIEGHTDDRPIGNLLRRYYPSNWELSSARASSAIRELEQLGISKQRMQAVGHASNLPVLAADTADARQANRRIDILLYPPIELIFQENL